jgi:hypothetical protein
VEARGGALGWGTALQAGRSRVQFPTGDKGGVGLTTLHPSHSDCLGIWEPQPPGTFGACNKAVQGLLYLYRTLSTDTTKTNDHFAVRRQHP